MIIRRTNLPGKVTPSPSATILGLNMGIIGLARSEISKHSQSVHMNKVGDGHLPRVLAERQCRHLVISSDILIAIW